MASNVINIPSFFESPQNALFDAFTRKNLQDFKFALERLKADPNGIINDRTGASIFKEILREPNSGEYIELCIEYGADLYENNKIDLRPPIFYAIDSFSPENLEIFLKNFNKTLLNLKFGDKNCLHLLTKQISNENFDNLSSCIKILLENGTSINTPDDHSRTPFYMLLKAQKKVEKCRNLVEFVVENYAVDVYSYRTDEMLKMFKTQNPSLAVPEKFEADLTFEFMRNLLLSSQDQKFIKTFPNFREKNFEDENFHEFCAEFVYEAVKSGSDGVVRALSGENIDVNRRMSGVVKSPAELACSYGYYKVLEALVKSRPPDENLLHGILNASYQKYSTYSPRGGNDREILRFSRNSPYGSKTDKTLNLEKMKTSANSPRIFMNSPQNSPNSPHLKSGLETQNSDCIRNSPQNFGSSTNSPLNFGNSPYSPQDFKNSKSLQNLENSPHSQKFENSPNSPQNLENSQHIKNDTKDEHSLNSRNYRNSPNSTQDFFTSSNSPEDFLPTSDLALMQYDSKIANPLSVQNIKNSPNSPQNLPGSPNVEKTTKTENSLNLQDFGNSPNPPRITPNSPIVEKNSKHENSSNRQNFGNSPNPLRPLVNHKKCFEIALPYCDVNQPDELGFTPLHYAAHHRNHEAVHQLFSKNAFLAPKNIFGESPLDDLRPDVLVEVLDSRVEVLPVTKDMDQKELNISIDFGLLRPPPGYGEVESLEMMSKNPELRPLIAHAVISAFIFLKWKRLSLVFYGNFLVFTVLMLTFIKYIVMSQTMTLDEKSESFTFWIFKILSFFGIFVLFLREFLQFLLSLSAGINYFASPINIFEIFFIFLAFSSQILENSVNHSEIKILRAFTILCAAFEFLHLVGELPFLSISCHMKILQKVALTFLKSLLLYSILLVAFAMSFFVLFSGNGREVEKIENSPHMSSNSPYLPNEVSLKNGGNVEKYAYSPNSPLFESWEGSSPRKARSLPELLNVPNLPQKLHNSPNSPNSPQKVQYLTKGTEDSENSPSSPQKVKYSTKLTENMQNSPRNLRSKRNSPNSPQLELSPNQPIPLNSPDFEYSPNPPQPNDDDDDAFTNFAYPGIAIIKTFVMLTGEFDAASMSLHSKGAYYCIMFMLFIFMVTIVLFNLLSALAVDDTQKIKAEGELVDLCARIAVLRRYEKMILGKFRGIQLWNRLEDFVTLFHGAIPNGRIYVQPNKGYLVTSKELESSGSESFVEIEDDGSDFGCIKSRLRLSRESRCCLMCSQLDKKIGKKLRNIIDERKEREREGEGLWTEVLEMRQELREIKELLRGLRG